MDIKTTKGLHSEQIKMLVYGKAGVGKTTLAGTLPEDQTLIVSAESGLLCLAEKNIAVTEVKSFDAIQHVYTWLKKDADQNQFRYIVIDSLTEISDMLVHHLKRQPEYADPKNTLKLWGEFGERMISLIKAFRDLPRHVIFTALVEDVNDGGALLKKPMIAGNKAQQALPSLFDEVFYLHIDPVSGDRALQTQPSASFEGKDRSGRLANPETPDIGAIISKISGKPII